jgi:hypothetical protein
VISSDSIFPLIPLYNLEQVGYNCISCGPTLLSTGRHLY